MRWRNHENAAFARCPMGSNMGEHCQLQSFCFSCAGGTLKHNNLLFAENPLDESALLLLRRQG